MHPAQRAPSLVGPSSFRLLGETHDLQTIGWDDPALALLWRYNLHYFDDLNARAADARSPWHRKLIARWCAENAPCRGTAYAPYPTSLRIVNWVKCFVGGRIDAAPEWLDSLALQARWLVPRLERHLLGNHLFANAKALVHVGLFFDGAEADGWLAKGLAILRRELPEQILADGGHFERSPMYHALALEDLLDLLNIIATLAPPMSSARTLLPTLGERASAMLRWLHCLRHPGGALARFNDCAEGIAPPVAEIERVANALGILAQPLPATDALIELEPSGYVRAQRGLATALLDVAPVGPDYLPGHAHADTLSFELSLRARELIVNRGTSVYGTGPRRLLERGTAAHSTVQIGTHDSSEVWSGFRVGRRARPGAVAIEGETLSASHDGYTHLPGRPRHFRRWRFAADQLRVEDWLKPNATEPAIARFHLAPGLRLERTADASVWRVADGDALLATAEIEVGAGTSEAWQHATGFGELVPAETLAVRLRDGRSAVCWRWAI